MSLYIKFYNKFDIILKSIQMLTHQGRSQSNPIGHVTSPIVVGGAIIAVKCKQGIIIANDTLLSYGGLLKYPDVNRVQKLTENIVLTATGQYSDFQQVTRKMNQLTRESESFDDHIHFTVKDYANYLGRICYEKRNKQNPYYNNFVIAGFENGESFLASVDLYGNYIKDDYVTLGFSKHFGLALLANQWNLNKTYEECKQIIRQCFSILYVRTCQSIDRVQFTFVGKQGAVVHAPEKIQSKWDFKEFKERKNEKLWQ